MITNTPGIINSPLTAYGEYLYKQFRLFARLLEFAAGLPKGEALIEAARMASALAADLRYPWSSLREALPDHSELAAQTPERQGPVDSLPWGSPTFDVRDGRLQPL